MYNKGTSRLHQCISTIAHQVTGHRAFSWDMGHYTWKDPTDGTNIGLKELTEALKSSDFQNRAEKTEAR